MRHLGRVMIAYIILFIGIFGLAAAAFGIKIVLMAFAAVHAASLLLFFLLTWGDQSWPSEESATQEQTGVLTTLGGRLAVGGSHR